MEGVWRHGKAIVYAVSIASLAGNMMALMMTHSPARLPAIAIAMPRSMLSHIPVPGSLLHPYSDLLLYFLLNGIVLAILLKSGVWARYHGDGAGAGRGEANTIIFRKGGGGGEDSGEEEEEEEEEAAAGGEAMVDFLTRGLLDYANPAQEGEGAKDLMLSSSRSQDEVLLLGLDPAMAGSTTKLDIKVQEDQKEEEEKEKRQKQEEYGIIQLNSTTTTGGSMSSSIDPSPPSSSAAAVASIFSIEPIEWNPDATDTAIASDPDSDSADAGLAAAAAIASLNAKLHLHSKLHNRHHGNISSHHKPKAKKRNNHAQHHHSQQQQQHHHHHNHSSSDGLDDGDGGYRKPGDGDDYNLDRHQFNERVESFITKFKRNLTMQREASLTRLLSLLQPSSNGNKRNESPG